MFCIAAFVVLGILGIFSATHRKLAREAFDCVFRRVTLRPCNTGFDVKMKSKILGSLLHRSPRLAKGVNRHFELLSWLFMISTVLSVFWAMRGLYNYYAYGSCNGLNASGFCVFDPTGENNKVTGSGGECRTQAPAESDLSIKDLDFTIFPTKTQGETELIFIGCYSCDFTRKTYPIIQKLIQSYPVTYRFAHFPVKNETEYLLEYDVCVEQQNAQLIWDYTDMMFSNSKENIQNETFIRDWLVTHNIDLAALDLCRESDITKATVEDRVSEIQLTGIYGTPTVFINQQPVVGPKPYRVYRRMVTGSWF